MAISTQTFTTMRQNAVSAMQGACSALIDLTVGSVLRSFVDAYCGLALWLQGLALQIASLTRFATSYGADADSWGADYDYQRLAAVPASGPVTFARYTATTAATVNLGATVQTQDGTLSFAVIADASQPTYNTTLKAYVIPAGTVSAQITVQCTTAGSGGNVAAGLINTLGGSIPGIDTVTNAGAFDNGGNPETDPAYKARFPQYLASLSKATPTAVENAVLSLQEGVTCSLVQNYNLSGYPQAGYFYVVVDDGSGSPSGTFMTNVTNAIQAVDALATPFGVFPPTIVTANIAAAITVAAGYDLATVETAVTAALTTAINALPLGQGLPWSEVAGIIWTVAGVTNVTAWTVNGGTADIAANPKQRIKVGTISVT